MSTVVDIQEKITGDISELRKILHEYSGVDTTVAIEFLDAISDGQSDLQNEIFHLQNQVMELEEESLMGDDEDKSFGEIIDTGIGSIEYNASALPDIQIMEELSRLIEHYGSNRVLDLMQNTPLTLKK